MNRKAFIIYDGAGRTIACFEDAEEAKKQYDLLKAQWDLLDEVPIPDSRNRFAMNIRIAVSALLISTSHDQIGTVGAQHLLPRSYIKNFGMVKGPKTIYLDVLNPKTLERLLVEHSPLVVAEKKHYFYTDLVEHLLSKLETGYSKSLETIKEGKLLTVAQLFDVSVFMASLLARWPQPSEYLELDKIRDTEQFSQRLVSYLMPQTIINMTCYHWKFIVLPDEDPELSFVTSFTPILPALIPIDEEIITIPNPLSPNEKGKNIPIILFFPLSNKMGVYLVSKQASPILRKNLVDSDNIVSKLLEPKNEIIDFRKLHDDGSLQLVNTGNLTILGDATIKVEDGKQAIVFLSPDSVPFKSFEESLKNKVKDPKIIQKLYQISFTDETLDIFLSSKAASKPVSSKPAVHKFKLDMKFDDWWKEIVKSNKEIYRYFKV